MAREMKEFSETLLKWGLLVESGKIMYIFELRNDFQGSYRILEIKIKDFSGTFQYPCGACVAQR